jgi:phosphoglycerate dehydrogenase-like enzyme
VNPASGAPLRVICSGFVFDGAAEAVIRRHAPQDLELTFAERPEAVTPAMLAAADVLVTVAAVTDAMMRAAPRLRFIQKWGTGYDKIDTVAAARHGIAVAITSGVNADTIAEHALTLMLAVMRNVVVADRALRAGRWIPGELRPRSQRLYGKTVGIVGFGNTGRALARQLKGFAAKVLYCKRSGRVADEAAFDATCVGLDELYARSDVVTLHCPGGAQNRHMIDRRSFAQMKPGAVFINVARGELVVEQDLVDALTTGKLSGAGLDVFSEEPLRADSPLRALDNVVLTPHCAGSVMDDIAAMAFRSFDNIRAFFAGEPIRATDRIVDPATPRTLPGARA